jgi:hypothetical protein
MDDLREVVVIADALHCQCDHVAYLAARRAHWILTIKGNQPSLRQLLAGLPWWLVPDADRDITGGHGRREIRTLKILSVSTVIDFPNAVQALQIRRRSRLHEPRRFTTETVYAITDLQVHQAKPTQLADWIRGRWSIENKIHWSATSPTTKTGPKSAPATARTSWPPSATPPSAPCDSPGSPTSPPPDAITPATPTAHWRYSA